MKFDSNQAWKQAASQVSANRDVLIALAGVFLLLPVLAFSLFTKDAPTAVAALDGAVRRSVARAGASGCAVWASSCCASPR